MKSHRFKLNRRASPRALAKFESKHGIELPDDFRAFVAELGNGGAGPYYGILPVDRWTEHLPLDELPDGFLAAQCPIPPDFERHDGWLDTLGLSEDDAFRGTIAIASQGCTYYCALVVSGPCRGRVLYIDEDLQAPHLVADQCFADWYERWLDETLAGYEIFWFGMGPGGSDGELIRRVATAERPVDRAEAAAELGRRRTPSRDVIQALTDATRDPEPQVQSAALRALRYSRASAVSIAPAFLAHASAEVRDAAAWLLRKVLDPSTIEPLRQALRTETDVEVFFGIGCALSDLHGLVANDLVPFLDSESDKLRAHAAFFLGKSSGSSAITALVAALDDPHQEVRIYAVQSLRSLGAADAIDALKARANREQDNLVMTNIRVALRELDK